MSTLPQYAAMARNMLSQRALDEEAAGNLLSMGMAPRERARAGEMRCMAIAGVCRDGAAMTSYVGTDDLFALMGAVHHLLRRVSSEVVT